MLLTVIVGLGVALAALEIGLRWADEVPFRAPAELDQERWAHPFIHGIRTVAHHRVLGWTMWPNLRWNGAYPMSTDEHGTRLPSTAARPLPTAGILVSGDSFAAGAEVGDADTWPAMLEAALGQPIVNAACGGYGTDQIVMRIEEMLDRCRPSTVIASFFWQDILRAEFKTYNHVHKPYYTVENGALLLWNSPVPLFDHRFANAGFRRFLLENCYVAFCAARFIGLVRTPKPGDEPYEIASPSGTGITISCLLLDRLKALAAREGFRLVFLMQYGSNDFDQAAPHDQPRLVVEHARAAGIETIDSWPEIRSIFLTDPERFRGLWVLQADGITLGHMSAAGNRLIADQVMAVLAPASMVAQPDTAAAG
jgi:lysophospholipase L1-like esterase